MFPTNSERRVREEMLQLRTSQGTVDWKLGDLSTSSSVFLYGYCSNFARVLQLRRPKLELCVVIDKRGSPDHYLLKDEKSYLDARGRLTESDLLSYEGEVCDDIELEELEQDWEEEWDYLAESIMDEYLAKIMI
jgi:hypothetical protein